MVDLNRLCGEYPPVPTHISLLELILLNLHLLQLRVSGDLGCGVALLVAQERLLPLTIHSDDLKGVLDHSFLDPVVQL